MSSFFWLNTNQMFEASEIYLRTKINPSIGRLKISKALEDKDICVNIGQGEKIMDTFEGIQLTWQMISGKSQMTRTDLEGRFISETVEQISIELSFHKKYWEKVMSSYLPYVLERSKAMRVENFYRRAGKAWKCGYLLYGPPGTVDSSLIGGITNIYGLQLTGLRSNSVLRSVLVSTANQ